MYSSAVARSRSRSRAAARRNPVRAQGIHSFNRYCAAETLEMNGVFLAKNYKIAFTDMVQPGDFTSLFDQYRITKVVFKIQMMSNPDGFKQLNAVNDNVNNWFPKLWYIVDHDGGPTETILSIKERQGVKCKILRPNKQIRIAFQPKCRTLTYSTPTSTGYAPKNIKIDMSDINVEHYGLNLVFDSNGLDPLDAFPYKFIIERKLYFTCYGVR